MAGCTSECDRRSANCGRGSGQGVYVTGMWERAWEDTLSCQLWLSLAEGAEGSPWDNNRKGTGLRYRETYGKHLLGTCRWRPGNEWAGVASAFLCLCLLLLLLWVMLVYAHYILNLAVSITQKQGLKCRTKRVKLKAKFFTWQFRWSYTKRSIQESKRPKGTVKKSTVQSSKSQNRQPNTRNQGWRA